MNINVNISSDEVSIVYFDSKTKSFQVRRHDLKDTDSKEMSETNITELVVTDVLQILANTFADGKIHKKNYIHITCAALNSIILLSTVFHASLSSFKFESEYIFKFKLNSEEDNNV